MKDSKSLFFEKLTPTDDCDISIYESAIDFAFKEDDIRNVAISGAYGAGKSSVLAAYKVKHREKKFLHISLAHFKDNVKEVSSNNNNEYSEEAILEGKMLNQLIRQIPSKKIPQTVFRVKETKSNKVIILYVVLTLLFLLSLFPVFFFDGWFNFFGSFNGALRLLTYPCVRIISGVVCFVILGVFLFNLLVVQKNKNLFKKLNIHGNEIEIFEESMDSIFDKYLNEMLYLLDNSETDVVVFEDIDRYNTQKLFEKLREINTLVNINRAGRRKKIIRFFYLVRDDIFTSKDRTKFFDYIIPIVPVIDSSNSYDQIITHLKKNGLESKFDESFLQGISLYVDDMRLLKNICNEFLIYYNRLNTIELDYNKMLALITYKNLFPRDYQNLQINRGFVFELFKHKRDLIKNKIELLNKEIADLKKETTEDDDNVSKLINEKNNEIRRTENSKLSSLLERGNIDEYFAKEFCYENGEQIDFSEIRSNEYYPLVKYLIRNGYIDESYQDYMTYFYANSLSIVDKIFLRSVTDKKAKPYEYELKSPEKAFKRLNINDFDQEETLNYSLCEYLLSTQRESQHLEHMIAQLRNTNNTTFVAGFFDCTKHIPEFIKTFNKYWPKLFEAILEKEDFNEEQIKCFSIETLYYTDEEMLDLVNENGALTSYINSTEDYLAIDNPNIEILIKAFKHLEVEMLKIDYESANRDLLKEVYENDLYALNFDNISLILEKIWGISSMEDIRHKNYSIICTDNDSPIYQRIENKMPDYINVILEECKGKIYDEEKVVINILNRNDIDSTCKEKYIESLETSLNDLTKFEDYSIWSRLLDSGLLICSESNIWHYLEEKKEMDSSLINYINNADRPLDFSKESIVISEEEQDRLFDLIVECNEINNQQYQEIITHLEIICDQFNIPDIHDTKMKILIENDVIEMNYDTLKYIREKYQSVLFDFIRKNIKKYLEIMDGTIFSQEELEEILKWDIEDSYKIELLKYSSTEMTIIDKNYSPAVSVHILENNLLQSDLEDLYRKYSKQYEEVKEFIINYAAADIDDIVKKSGDVEEALVKDLLLFNEISLDIKKRLLASLIQYITKDKTIEYLTNLGLENFIKIFDYLKRPTFKITDYNRDLLDAFKNKGWIHEYLEDENKAGYYKIRRRKRRG